MPINLTEEIVRCYYAGGKVLICGNGGLAAEAEHFTAELMGKFSKDVYIPCIALTCPSALITAISNDVSFADVFAHQIRTLGKKGDVLIAMTTSQSPNIITSIEAGESRQMVIAVLCSNWSKINYANLIRIAGVDGMEVQNNLIAYLHRVAKEVKELINDKSLSREPQ